MQPRIPKNVPERLRAHRVIVCVMRTLIDVRRVEINAGMARRDATRSRGALAFDWNTLDLYTLSMDLADNDEQRILISQARASLIDILCNTRAAFTS